jgi:hypothetical protein
MNEGERKRANCDYLAPGTGPGFCNSKREPVDRESTCDR